MGTTDTASLNRRWTATRILAALTGLAVSVALASCGGSAADDTRSDRNAKAPTGSVSPSSTLTPSAPVPNTFDVNGHQMYMSCTGTGSPTVVYIHGWINDTRYVPHEWSVGVAQRLSDDFRVCVYDRRNVGSSEVVDAVQSPDDMLEDLETLLREAGTEPPYLLLAGSFGGLLGYSYLSHHPDEVTGMVLLDAMFPDELALDRYLPEEFTFLHFRDEDRCCSQERISQYDLIDSLQRYLGHEPAVPLVYVASRQEPPHQEGYESPEFDARKLAALKVFIDRFEPGRLTWVDAPHFMEPVVPDEIAQAVRDVAALAS